MDPSQLIERWGFPVAFAVWLMITHTRELREIRSQLNQLSILLAVVAKTLDVRDDAAQLTTTANERKET